MNHPADWGGEGRGGYSLIAVEDKSLHFVKQISYRLHSLSQTSRLRIITFKVNICTEFPLCLPTTPCNSTHTRKHHFLRFTKPVIDSINLAIRIGFLLQNNR